jgi:RHS repeat-associated protein
MNFFSRTQPGKAFLLSPQLFLVLIIFLSNHSTAGTATDLPLKDEAVQQEEFYIVQVPDSLEYQALVDLYNSTGGNMGAWDTTTNWLQGTTAADFATWHGVTVENGDVVAIDLQENNLTGTVPATLGQLGSLQELYLKNNNISAVEGLSRLTQLNYLYLDKNELSSLTGIDSLTSLTELGLGGNQFTTVPNISGLTYLVKLFLDNNQLNSLPSYISGLTQLQVLYLNGNQLSTIPSLGQLTQLQVLAINDNHLSAIPDLSNLKVLRELFLSNLDKRKVNTFTTVPDLSALTLLQVLYLNDNQFTEIPAYIGGFSQLTQLGINGNQLTSLPDLSGLTLLQYFYLNNNYLTFSQLEGFFTGAGAYPYVDFSYSPQLQNIRTEERYLNPGDSTVLLVSVDTAAHNIYNWQEKQADGSWEDIPDANDQSYPAGLDTGETEAYFRCRITNEWVVDLELYSSTYHVTGEGAVILEDLAKNRPNGDVAPVVEASTRPAVATGTSNVNYVRTFTPRVPITSEGAIGFESPVEQVTISTQYFDGLGRPIQSVSKKASPQQQDVVVPIAYDAFGRQEKEYLPYVQGTGGAYRTNALQEQWDFYQGSGDDIASSGYPFKQHAFEPSPLNRVLKTAAPGENWRMGSGKEISFDWRGNNEGDGEIRIWQVDETNIPPTTAAVYDHNQLHVTVTTDEHDSKVLEYKDKQGLVVLKKVQLRETPASAASTTDYLWTYYIYDDFNRLRFVIQPEGVKEAAAAGWNISQDLVDRFCFRYRYDGRGRMIEKKVPGAAPVEMVYNERDLLVLSRDGEQKEEGNWLFTKYDQLNRPVLTGMLKDPTNRADMQNQADAATVLVENRAANTQHMGYTNDAFPTLSLSADTYFLTATYFDDYDLDRDGDEDEVAYHTSGLPQEPVPGQSNRGRVTASKVKVLEDSKWLTTVSFYDQKGRVVQTQSDNHLGGKDISTTQYRNIVNDEVLLVKQENQKGSEEAIISYTEHTYDHSGRLLDTYHKIGEVLFEEQSVGSQQVISNESAATAYSIQATSSTGGAVTWTDYTGVEVDGSMIKKTAPNGWGNAGASSAESMAPGDDGWIEWSIAAGLQHYQVGLSETNTSHNFGSGNYIVLAHDDKRARVYEKGNFKKFAYADFATGDVFRIERSGGVVTYWQNGTQFYQSSDTSATSLLVDVAFYNQGSYINSVTASFVTPPPPPVSDPSAVTWTDYTGVEVIGDKIAKTAPNGWGNAGASSAESLAAGEDGWIEWKVSAGPNHYQVGLSEVNVNHNFGSGDYLVFSHEDKRARVYEKGSFKKFANADFDTATVFRIQREGGIVTFWQNGVQFHQSSQVSTTSLLVDVAFYNTDSYINKVTASFVSPPPPPTVPGAVTWTDYTGVEVDGSMIKKTAPNGWGNAGASSAESMAPGDDGWIEWSIAAGLQHYQVGLSETNTSHNFGSGNYIVLAHDDKRARVYEKGNFKKFAYADFATGDVFRIERSGGVVTYWQNGTQFYQSSDTSSTSLIVDIAMYNQNSYIESVKASFGNGTDDPGTDDSHFLKDGILISRNQYNEIGELINKQLHSVDDSTFLQSVDYRYNIRGWLSSINEVAASFDTSNDFFSMNLYYDWGFDKVAYNGNIAGIKWKSANDIDTHAYGYVYDRASRLKGADYVAGSSGNWTINENRFDVGGDEAGPNGEKRISYDLNGNIMGLYRNGLVQQEEVEVFDKMDRLAYQYEGNRLKNVNEESGGSESFGFKQRSGAGTTSQEYFYDANGNMNKDLNKGIKEIRYNHLNLPKEVIKDDDSKIVYTYDAAGIKLRQQVFSGTGDPLKQTDYVGGLVYEDGVLQFMQHGEGRVLLGATSADGQPEYQYHMKDHLGNVRLTFTSKPQVDTYMATMETERAQEEESQFLNVKGKPIGKPLDHTHKGGKHNIGEVAEVARLNGSRGERNGPRKTLAVMAGDTIRAMVRAKYLDLREKSSDLTADMILAALSGAPGYTVTVEGAATRIAMNSTGATALLNPLEEQEQPKAFLSWQFLPANGRKADEDGGFKQVSAAAAISNATGIGNHEVLEIEYIVKQKGWINLELDMAAEDSYEAETRNIDVYFDDFEVAHHHGLIVQEDSYYPFGLTFNEYKREGSLENKFKFQGQEHQDDLDLGWVQFKWRNHDPALGRFFNVDPLADEYVYNSPYAFSENKVTNHIELEGLEAQPAQQAMKEAEDLYNYTVYKAKEGWNSLVRSVTGAAEAVVEAIDSNTPQVVIQENNPDGEYYPPNPEAPTLFVEKEDVDAGFSVLGVLGKSKTMKDFIDGKYKPSEKRTMSTGKKVADGEKNLEDQNQSPSSMQEIGGVRKIGSKQDSLFRQVVNQKGDTSLIFDRVEKSTAPWYEQER